MSRKNLYNTIDVQTFEDGSTKSTNGASNSFSSIHPVYLYAELSNSSHYTRMNTNWFGIFLALLSGIFFTISSALVKGITNVDPMVLLITRAVIQIVMMLTIAWKNSHHLLGPQGQRGLIHMQGLVGGMTLSLLYISFRRLPLGDATTVIFSSPIIVMIMSFIWLKEPCGFLRIAVMGSLVLGVILIAQPPFIFEMQEDTLYDATGYTCAVFATIFTAMNIVVMRKCLEIHYSVVVLNLSVWSLISAIIFLIILPTDNPAMDFRDKLFIPCDFITLSMIMLVAVTGLLGQILIANSLKIESAGKVSVTRSLDIILAYVIQIYFFEEVPTMTSIIGALLILSSVVTIGFEKHIYSLWDSI
ncbi:hypothetical protein QAD02_015662 [Eretmocerus hayati]|uniref:Uncharacterized protein n=1 Tax=Eretmocerus hayati TaxID=131215 RepID=A0ACC2PDP1_9HYME|nr:hypothetical protein QAD02_015662 [Eretmocerus hayati]